MTTKPQHTPGPWHIGNVEGGPSRISKRVHYLAIYDADDNFVCEIYTRRIEEPFTDAEQYRAARIVACVNACQPFDDPDAGILGLREDRAAFKDERDALRADARRIVACVNACEGMTTGDLEQDSAACTKTIKELATERDALREQNRRLREALRVLLPHLRANCAGSPVAVRHTSDAAALLAEIEGEK